MIFDHRYPIGGNTIQGVKVLSDLSFVVGDGSEGTAVRFNDMGDGVLIVSQEAVGREKAEACGSDVVIEWPALVEAMDRLNKRYGEGAQEPLQSGEVVPLYA